MTELKHSQILRISIYTGLTKHRDLERPSLNPSTVVGYLYQDRSTD